MRRTGKTYRVILCACLAASEGKNVIVVSANGSARRNAINIARQLSENFAKFEGTDMLKFPNGSWVKFLFLLIFLKEEIMG